MTKVLTFNFYLDQVRLCDQYYDINKECYNPRFFDHLNQIILDKQPDVLILTTQDEVDNNFHMLFLPKYIKNYDLLARSKNDHINLSIYTRSPDYHLIEYDEEKGSLGVTFSSPVGDFLVVSASVPDHVPSLNSKDVIKNLQTVYSADKIDYAFFLLHLPEEHNIVQVLDQYHSIKFIEGYDIDTNDGIMKHLGKVDLFEIKIRPKILCFSWNTDQTPLCGSYGNQTFGKLKRSNLFSTTSCYNPLFFEKVKAAIQKHHPELVALSTEGDLESGTYFHAEFLRRQMTYLGYTLISNDKLVDMRLSIYSNKKVDLIHPNRQFISYNEDVIERVAITRGSSIQYDVKSMVKYVNIDDQMVAFLTLDVPDTIDNPEEVNIYLTTTLQTLTKNADHVFILGHFSEPSYSNGDFEELMELHQFESYHALTDYKEDYDYPTFKLKPFYYKNKFEFREGLYDGMSWHNRIFFKNARVIDFKTIYGYPMLVDKSEHLGVMGIYQLT